MSILSMLAFRMVTQVGLDGCLELHKMLKYSEIQPEQNEISLENKNNLSKSAKRRLRKKKLKENSQHYKINDNNDISTVKIDDRAYKLVTLNSKRTASDFLERTLMAAFLLKCLQKVNFFNNTIQLEGFYRTNFIEASSIILYW